MRGGVSVDSPAGPPFCLLEYFIIPGRAPMLRGPDQSGSLHKTAPVPAQRGPCPAARLPEERVSPKNSLSSPPPNTVAPLSPAGPIRRFGLGAAGSSAPKANRRHGEAPLSRSVWTGGREEEPVLQTCDVASDKLEGGEQPLPAWSLRCCSRTGERKHTKLGRPANEKRKCHTQ